MFHDFSSKGSPLSLFAWSVEPDPTAIRPAAEIASACFSVLI